MTQLPFIEAGAGSEIVLLHAFPVDHRIWDAVSAELAKKYRVIRPDLRGFGKNPPASKLTIPEMAADIVRLMRHLHASPCAIAGLSMGGYVAQAIARDFPGVADRLFIVDSKSAGDTPCQREARDAMADLAIKHGSGAVFEKMKPVLLGPDASDDVVGRLKELVLDQSPLTIAAAARALRDRDDFSEFMRSIDIPVHLIFGDQDAIMPPDAAAALQAAIPRSTLAMIDGAGHLSPLEKPREVAAAIAAQLGHG